MANSTITRDVVTVMITPADGRKQSACWDLNTPVLLGRFLQDNNFDPETGTIGPRSAPHGTLGFVRGLELDWVQEVIAQLEAGHDFWTRSTRAF